MSAQTVSNAVARRDSGPAELVRQSRDWFRTVVPSHIDANAFVALAIANLRKNPSLAAAAQKNPASFMAALSECARLGLVPGDTYHLVPFGSEITGIVDYTGEIELIYRAGAVSSVKAEIVYRRDRFRYTTDMDRPEHEPDWFGDRGEIIGAYAYAVMKDGATSKVVIYSKAEIDKVKAVSKTSGRPDSPWNQWYDRMALKTVIHRLEHFVPTSAEYRREQLRAAAEISQQVNSATIAGQPQAAAEAAGIVDAEIVDTPEDVPPAETAPDTPPSRGQRAAGGTSRKPKQQHEGNGGNLAGLIVERFEKQFGVTDRNDRLILTASLLRLDEVPESTNKLGTAAQKLLLGAMEKSKDLDALKAEMDKATQTGEVPDGQ